ncbi:MAG: type II and III secretion system protein [Bacteroidetes bacterium]|nr:type II and III secretion system protein [Bacteroidota bacterium]
MKKCIILSLFLLVGLTGVYAQTDPAEFDKQLTELAKSQPGLLEKVQVNVSGIGLSDFITAVAFEHNLNVSVDEQLKTVVVNNFYDALVKDVFVFIVKKYELDVEVIGTIIVFKKPAEKPVEIPVVLPKEIFVEYKKENQFLSLDLKKDTLSKVAETITRKSGRNVILAPNIKDRVVSVYIENRPFDEVIDMMCKSNGLKSTKDQNGFYYLELDELPVGTNAGTSGRNSGGVTTPVNTPSLNIKISALDNQKLDVEATNTPLKDIISMASDQLGEHYFMYDVPEGNATLKVKNVSFMELLAHVMNGTDYTFKKTENYYLIGNRKTEGLRAVELIQLENRTIESVMEIIPKELVSDIEIKEFVELNGLILSGSYLKIEELKSFLRSVDKVVPMVQIDIIIVFSKKSSQLSTGMKAGLADQPVVTNGDIFPGLDVTLGAETVNGLIQAFNGFGIINIGAVTPNFYLSLKALESNSVIDIASTPKISTLNGHEATFSVGETSYYREEVVNVQPSISGGNVISNKVWKSTDANLNITVKPFVSADEYVTLEIKVEQNDFAGKEDPTAPPNKTTQTFESLIRVKNGEMILMGGLEKDSKEDSGEGTPLISRVPVLKWFFSSRTKNKEKSKLHIFIRPTVTY